MATRVERWACDECGELFEGAAQADACLHPVTPTNARVWWSDTSNVTVWTPNNRVYPWVYP